MGNRCKNCGREFHPVSCPSAGNGLCADCWKEKHPGQMSPSQQSQQGMFLLMTSPIWGPFWLLWKLKKPIAWCCCKVGRACWVVGMNKWTWTIFTAGFSWLTYKLLVYVYEKEH